MYQDAAGGVEAAEYHIMYDHYDPALSASSPVLTTTTSLSRVGGGGERAPTIATDGHLVEATLSASEGLKVAAQDSHVDMGQISAELVASSSIETVMTSMVVPSDCQSGGGGVGGRKLPSQVIFKLLGSDFQDVVRMIAEQDMESVTHHPILTRNGALVQAKLSGSTLIDTTGQLHHHHHHHQENEDDELRAPIVRLEREEGSGTTCSMTWTCAYCNQRFPSPEAIRVHHESDCNLQTTTSQSTVDALMSPLRPSEEPTYELKVEKGDILRNEDLSDATPSMQEEDSPDFETAWSCAVCGLEFSQPKDLGHHYQSHTVQELSLALIKLTTPHQKIKRSEGGNTNTTCSLDHLSITSVQSLKNSRPDLRWNKDQLETKVEKEIVDNPGDTPPQTPPQEKFIRKVKRKPGPKAKQQEKTEKRKYIRKLGEDGKPLRQREYKVSPPGQGSRDPHRCLSCNKVLSSRGNLAKHMVLHEPNKRWKCDLCGIGFNAKRDERHHYYQHHTDQRPNKCKVCGKGYVDSNYLLAHMVVHKQEKPFSCDVCNKSFRTKRCVARHRKRHEKDKNFPCEICLKSFAVKADLTSHIRKVHSNKKAIKHHLVSQQPPSSQSQQEQVNQQGNKSKDLTEFLLPGDSSSHLISEQLLPSDLESESLGGTVTSKDSIFISSDPLAVPSIIPINGSGEGGGGCSYGVALTTPAGGPAGVGALATCIMINSAEEDVATHTVPPTAGLKFMYTTTPAATQQVGELEEIQQLSSSVGAGLVGGEGQLHHEGPLEGQHQPQDTAMLPTDNDGMRENHRGELGLGGGRGGTGRELIAGESHTPSSTHNPSPGFPLELISQTIQLDLQRTQPSATYLA